jgi:uncharacterized protein YegP (UPF0339 family)
MRFQVLRSSNGLYWWRIKGGNGEIMCSSEGYTTKQSALHAVYVVKTSAAGAPVEDLTI